MFKWIKRLFGYEEEKPIVREQRRLVVPRTVRKINPRPASHVANRRPVSTVTPKSDDYDHNQQATINLAILAAMSGPPPAADHSSRVDSSSFFSGGESGGGGASGSWDSGSSCSSYDSGSSSSSFDSGSSCGSGSFD